MSMNDIVAQFADEASFLWSRRDTAVGAPHFTLKDLWGLDERLEAHVDGLRVAGPLGWEACKANLNPKEPESLFPAAVLAFESGNDLRLKTLFDAAGCDPLNARPLISALGWLDYPKVQQPIERLLSATSPFHRYLGLAGSAVHRRHPGKSLHEAVADPTPQLTARALRAYGELGKGCDLPLPEGRALFHSPDEEIAFSAAWSAGLTGNEEAIQVLKTVAHGDSRFSYQALVTVFCCLPPAAALSFHHLLAASAKTLRKAVVGAGLAGDPSLVPWLLDHLRDPALARVAGEALAALTGIDLDSVDLRGFPPDGFDDDDDADADEAPKNDMRHDNFLPWLDPEAVLEWWQENAPRFPSGNRYFVGQHVSTASLREVLATASRSQRQRAVAALLLAVIEPGEALVEVRGPAFRQGRPGEIP